ncbi:hypothetical protein [Shewanella sp. NIFS-20-20]|uniref:hypothetical protein n=1 Tax=Shewanella sp. NIFS-20-20 TaxID=2853806 RepID=UPI001C480FEE|nr:hypothetical protein [Shewanella sp. NIFS-20-20]MBV7317008.1 hypothetical protein [Shewanella sp. NIFS-20-20]
MKMPKNRERSIYEFNKNLDLLRLSISVKKWAVISKFIGSDNKIRNSDFKKFLECIHDVDKAQWANYLRKLRDNEYESKRTRISIGKSTEEYLRRVMSVAGYNSFDELFRDSFVNNDEFNSYINEFEIAKLEFAELVLASDEINDKKARKINSKRKTPKVKLGVKKSSL